MQKWVHSAPAAEHKYLSMYVLCPPHQRAWFVRAQQDMWSPGIRPHALIHTRQGAKNNDKKPLRQTGLVSQWQMNDEVVSSALCLRLVHSLIY